MEIKNKLRNSKGLLIGLLILSCVLVVLYYYFFYRERLIFLGDEINQKNREQMKLYMGISYFTMRLSVFCFFLLMAMGKRRLKKISNWIAANLLLILPMVILWTAKYMSAPVLFSYSMAILEVADIYFKCNLIYLLIFIYRKIKKSRTEKNNP